MEITLTVKFVGADAMERAVRYLMADTGKSATPSSSNATNVTPTPAPSEVPSPAKRRAKSGKQTEPVIAPGPIDGPAEVRQGATKEAAQAALEKVFAAKGLQAARDLLSRHGVQRLQDMKPEQYGVFVQHVERVMAGGEV